MPKILISTMVPNMEPFWYDITLDTTSQEVEEYTKNQVTKWHPTWVYEGYSFDWEVVRYQGYFNYNKPDNPGTLLPPRNLDEIILLGQQIITYGEKAVGYAFASGDITSLSEESLTARYAGEFDSVDDYVALEAKSFVEKYQQHSATAPSWVGKYAILQKETLIHELKQNTDPDNIAELVNRNIVFDMKGIAYFLFVHSQYSVYPMENSKRVMVFRKN